MRKRVGKVTVTTASFRAMQEELEVLRRAVDVADSFTRADALHRAAYEQALREQVQAVHDWWKKRTGG